MTVKARIVEKFETYLLLLVSVVLAPAALIGFYAHMDARHDEKGSSQIATQKALDEIRAVEIKELKREKRKLETYLELAPSDTYYLSRKAEIRALDDEIAELER